MLTYSRNGILFSSERERPVTTHNKDESHKLLNEVHQTQKNTVHSKKDLSGERYGNPLQYSCLGNPMDRGTWQAIQSMVSQKV